MYRMLNISRIEAAAQYLNDMPTNTLKSAVLSMFCIPMIIILTNQNIDFA